MGAAVYISSKLVSGLTGVFDSPSGAFFKALVLFLLIAEGVALYLIPAVIFKLESLSYLTGIIKGYKKR